MRNPKSVIGKMISVDVQKGPDYIVDSIRRKVRWSYYGEPVVTYKGRFFTIFDRQSGWTIDLKDPGGGQVAMNPSGIPLWLLLGGAAVAAVYFLVIKKPGGMAPGEAAPGSSTFVGPMQPTADGSTHPSAMPAPPNQDDDLPPVPDPAESINNYGNF